MLGHLIVVGVEQRLGCLVCLCGFLAARMNEDSGPAQSLGEVSDGGQGALASDEMEQEGEKGQSSGREAQFLPSGREDLEMLENGDDGERREKEDQCDGPGAG